MPDNHLNLFYTYNRDNELIENNLTRAFVVFLSIISGQNRHTILSKLLDTKYSTHTKSISNKNWDFTNVQFALQSNIDRHIPRNSAQKILLTISSETFDPFNRVDDVDAVTNERINNNSNFSSVPDAWIYDIFQDFCILIEAKIGSNLLELNQLNAHVIYWFDLTWRELIKSNSLYSITWINVLETLEEVYNNIELTESSDRHLIVHLMEFITYYGYHVFKGIDYSGLDDQPGFHLIRHHFIENIASKINFNKLEPPLNFQIYSRTYNEDTQNE